MLLRLCAPSALPAALVRTLLVLLASGAVLRLFGQAIWTGGLRTWTCSALGRWGRQQAVRMADSLLP
ncbi:MAG: hypothetical protein DLM67_04725 [Candidatus Nephthysia bennettiae]|nr:MAG: hypothetical protein DLM67_04725 [Candidatus Dormibacteraeota bacterium]